ncbi:unnamed protein product [Echinostoma caproni]|uniref:Uncharacterized protein n=1 Tax=Echinostoma caproni TaxID=27848 RepID=A0A3P8LC52_9TREM|nr:unnamed protein product [Echinostoma caproni]
MWKIAARLEKSPQTLPADYSSNGGFDLTYASRNLTISSSGFMRKLFSIRNLSRESVKQSLEMVRQSECLSWVTLVGFERPLVNPVCYDMPLPTSFGIVKHLVGDFDAECRVW